MPIKHHEIDNYLFEDIYKVSEEDSKKTAIVFERKKYTFKEVEKSVDYYCHYLVSKGVKPGDHVALLGMNSFNWLIAFFAIVKVGAVARIVNILDVIGGIPCIMIHKMGIGARPEVDAVHRIGHVGAVDVKTGRMTQLSPLANATGECGDIPFIGQNRTRRFAVRLGDAVGVVQVRANGELLVGIDIRDERRDIRRGGSAHAEAQKAVFLDLRGGDDIDDAAAALGAVAGRRVGDDLNLLDAAGGHLLDELLECLGVHVGGFVVDPDLHGRDAAEGHVAIHIHLHTGGVLQGVRRRARLYSGVLGHVVKCLLTVNHIHRLLAHDLHYIQVCARLLHVNTTHVNGLAVASHRKGHIEHLIADQSSHKTILTGRHIRHLEYSLGIRQRMGDRLGRGVRFHQADGDEHHLFIVEGIHHRTGDGIATLGRQLCKNTEKKHKNKQSFHNLATQMMNTITSDNQHINSLR